MRFALIDEEKSHHGVSRMSRVLGVTAAGYHAWRKRPRSPRALEDEKLKERIGREQVGLIRCATTPHGAHRMDHSARYEPEAG